MVAAFGCAGLERQAVGAAPGAELPVDARLWWSTQRRAALEPDRVGAELGLTPAESHVALSLARGQTIRDVAAATGRSAMTIRWHLRRVFAKLGVSRQAELVLLVRSLEDVPEVGGSTTLRRSGRPQRR